jgi:hypothetical protein
MPYFGNYPVSHILQLIEKDQVIQEEYENWE